MAEDTTIGPEDQEDKTEERTEDTIKAEIPASAKRGAATSSAQYVRPAVDDSDLDIDLSTATPAPQKSGGCRGATAILFILLLVVAAGSIYYSIETKRAREAEEKARIEREASYKVQFSAVSKNVQKAVEASVEGDTEKALAYLAAAEAQLTIIGTRANDFNDQQWAFNAINKKKALLEAKDTITAEYKAYKETVREQFVKLSSKFEGVEYTDPDAAKSTEDEGIPSDAAPEAATVESTEPAPEAGGAPEVAPEAGVAPAPEQSPSAPAQGASPIMGQEPDLGLPAAR